MNIDGLHDTIRPKLVAVVRPATSRDLVVCFNGYGHKAYTRPDLPFQTALSGHEKLTSYNAHIIWFAEANESWYLEHQADIFEKVAKYILNQQIDRVKLFGGSAGGYAAFRMGLLIDDILRQHQNDAALLSFSLNPQTGFRPELIKRIKDATSGTAFENDLGKNPVILGSSYYELCKDMKVDFSELMSGYKPRNFAAVILSDFLNPIEKSFCEDIPVDEYILLVPHYLGLSHIDGASKIYHHGKLWEFFDGAMPFSRVTQAEDVEVLKSLRDDSADQRIASAHQ